MADQFVDLKSNLENKESTSISDRSVSTSYYGYPKVNELDINGGESKTYTFTIPKGNEHDFIVDFSTSTAQLDDFQIDFEVIAADDSFVASQTETLISNSEKILTLAGGPSQNTGRAASTSLINEKASGDPMTSWYDNTQVGEGTYYGVVNHLISPSQYDGKVDALAALNDPQHKLGAYGMCIKVKGNGIGLGADPIIEEKLVVIADVCPECKWGDIDLALNGDGRWEIDWHAVECPVGNHGLHYIFEGSHEWYLKIIPQVYKCPVEKLEIFHNGHWISGTIASHNYRAYVFSAPGHPTYQFPIKVRLTSIFGEEIIDQIPYIADESVTIPGSYNAQFERCSFDNHGHLPDTGTTMPTVSPLPTPLPTVSPTNRPITKAPSVEPTNQIENEANTEAFPLQVVTISIKNLAADTKTYAMSINGNFYPGAWYCQEPKDREDHKRRIASCFEKCPSSGTAYNKNPKCCSVFAGDICTMHEWTRPSTLSNGNCGSFWEPYDCKDPEYQDYNQDTGDEEPKETLSEFEKNGKIIKSKSVDTYTFTIPENNEDDFVVKIVEIDDNNLLEIAITTDESDVVIKSEDIPKYFHQTRSDNNEIVFHKPQGIQVIDITITNFDTASSSKYNLFIRGNFYLGAWYCQEVDPDERKDHARRSRSCFTSCPKNSRYNKNPKCCSVTAGEKCSSKEWKYYGEEKGDMCGSWWGVEASISGGDCKPKNTPAPTFLAATSSPTNQNENVPSTPDLTTSAPTPNPTPNPVTPVPTPNPSPNPVTSAPTLPYDGNEEISDDQSADDDPVLPECSPLPSTNMPGKRIIQVINNCDETIWPAFLAPEGYDPVAPSVDVVSVNPNDPWAFPSGSCGTFIVEDNLPSLRLWARTGCNPNNEYNCVTGSCRTDSEGTCLTAGEAPVSLFEATLQGRCSENGNWPDFYDSSLVDGYSLPFSVMPIGGEKMSDSSYSCGKSTVRAFDFHNCPYESRVYADAIPGSNTPITSLNGRNVPSSPCFSRPLDEDCQNLVVGCRSICKSLDQGWIGYYIDEVLSKNSGNELDPILDLPSGNTMRWSQQFLQGKSTCGENGCQESPAFGGFRGSLYYEYDNRNTMKNLVCCDGSLGCSPYQRNDAGGSCRLPNACPTLGAIDEESEWHNEEQIENDKSRFPQWWQEMRWSSNYPDWPLSSLGNNYAQIYKTSSPKAYSWQYNDMTSTYHCCGSDTGPNYKIIFCSNPTYEASYAHGI